MVISLPLAASGLGADSLHRRIDAAIQKAKRGAKGQCRVGARVVQIPQGKVVYSLRADEPFKPASNMKLVTTAAAIGILGRDFAFETRLAMCDDDLLVVGDGDPSSGDPKLLPDGQIITSMFHRWADALERQGIHEITGDLIIDDSIFESAFVHPSWDRDQLQNWYSAPVGGLNFNDNCLDAEAFPATGGGVAVELKPRLRGVEVVNHLTVGNGRAASIRRVGGEMTFELRGTVHRRRTLGPVAVVDPGLFFADAFRTALSAKGIRIAGETRREARRRPGAALPNGCRLIATEKRSLAAVLERANKDSQNLFAECLLKRVGYAYAVRSRLPDPVGSYETGNKAVEMFLKNLGAKPGDVKLADGSGLSHDNRLSPRILTDVLWAMYANADLRELYVNSLAVAGVDGTLKKRMKDIAGKVRAKTGYISGVRPLSGYVEGADGQWYCFSVMFDSIAGSTGPMNRCHNEICRLLATWTGP